MPDSDRVPLYPRSNFQRHTRRSNTGQLLVHHLEHEPFLVNSSHMQMRLGSYDCDETRFLDDLGTKRQRTHVGLGITRQQKWLSTLVDIIGISTTEEDADDQIWNDLSNTFNDLSDAFTLDVGLPSVRRALKLGTGDSELVSLMNLLGDLRH